jgi:D-alanyl-lipoteichoic acid acyltransferase DltB (MBOAT superfamily)
MLFNSLEFLVFCAIALAGYHLAVPPRAWRAGRWFLLVASYVFYMSWNPAYGGLLLLSTVLGFGVGLGLESTAPGPQRRALLGAGVGAALGLLAVFKYGDFALENARRLLPAPARDRLAPLGFALPIGISFYTFEVIAYLVDVYRGAVRATRSLLDVGLYLAFFPHLVAGPIVRPAAFLPQLIQRPQVTAGEVEEALVRIATGLVKKVVLADGLAAYVDGAFLDPASCRGLNALLAVYAYAFQIYCDFSGYTDMAIGLARLFGLRLPENFRRPYLASSPREFWQRWHVSLSTWLRDYLYVPLGGNRVSPARIHVNLMITMLLGGLWHGAAWTFVVWGAYHGLLLVGQRALGGWGGGVPRVLRQVLTFHLVSLGWVLFRADTLGGAWTLLANMGSLELRWSRAVTLTTGLLVLAVLLHVGPPGERAQRRFASLPPSVQGLGYAAVAVLVFLCSPATARFIYFQF